MPDDPRLTEREEGKTVRTTDGEEIGTIVSVHENVAAVEPSAGLTGEIRSALGWGDDENDTYRLQAGDVATVGDDDVVLREAIGEGGDAIGR